MHPKHLIPGLGNPETIKRFRELEKRAATLPVLFALFFSEGVKIMALSITELDKAVIIDVSSMLLLAAITALLYVYEIELEDIEDVVNQE